MRKASFTSNGKQPELAQPKSKRRPEPSGAPQTSLLVLTVGHSTRTIGEFLETCCGFIGVTKKCGCAHHSPFAAQSAVQRRFTREIPDRFRAQLCPSCRVGRIAPCP